MDLGNHATPLDLYSTYKLDALPVAPDSVHGDSRNTASKRQRNYADKVKPPLTLPA